MTRFEYLKSLNIEEMAMFVEGLVAVALGTRNFIDIERRISWLNGENELEVKTQNGIN